MSNIPTKKITVDIVLSMGNDCRTAKQLKTANLRKCAFPLDWMKGYYDLKCALRHFETDFVNFFKNKTIENVKKSKNYTKFWVRDTDTNMLSMHHFSADKDLEKQYLEDFMPIMMRRYKFVKKIMQHASHILFVCGRTDDIDALTDFLQEIHKMFPCKITMVNIRHDDKSEFYDENQVNDYISSEEIIINDDLKILTYSFDDRKPEKLTSWVGNTDKWQQCLAGYQLSWKTRLKSFFRRRNIRWVR